MANLKEIRTRISSVSSTKKITSAMKMVSAAKFKKAQNNLIKFRPFNEKITQLVDVLALTNGLTITDYFTLRKDINNVAILLITSNNSMCGAFNSNIIKTAISIQSSLKLKHPRANITFYCLGKKGEDVLRRAKFKVEQINPTCVDKPSIELTGDVFDFFFRQYFQGKIDRVELVFNKFKNAASQIQENETLLPILKQTKTETKQNFNKPIIEPDSKFLLAKLLPYYLKNKLHTAILESSAAEHGARMTAMHQATENATSLLNSLVLDYNKARQAAITNEILEIVSGANALKE